MPTQALFLMNSPVMKKHAEELARRVKKRVMKEGADDRERLALLWLWVLNRPITSKEKCQAEAFLVAVGDDWIGLCHALLGSNEFLMKL